MDFVSAQEEEASSSSTRSRCTNYDVFLSFRGEDTRKTFTDHLYTKLVDAGFRTFRDDDEIQRGESIKPELQNAIKQSRISIIVLSKDYASSTWCLDELGMILECRRITSGYVVLPVFYDVRPSEIRNQTGRTAEAFARYEKQFNAETDPRRKKELIENVKGWRAALRQVADLAGMELQNQADGHESKFIQKIVNVIGDKLSRTALYVALYLVGIHSRAKNINKWLQDDTTDVCVLGICGMGGIGKTTIAKFVYNQNYKSFAGSSFLANIREMSREPNGLVCLQRQLLSDILNIEAKIHNVDEGIIKIKKAISCKRVLLVLDDIDHGDQLYAVRGMQEWFYPGSKIIITTRHERLLKPHEVYKVEELGHDESIKLFSLYAFGEDCPTENYIEHTKRIVQLCGGLPLALQVIGSSLSGKNIAQWVSEVEKLEAIPHCDILKKLKISFDSLQDDYDKRLFLHIACFFVGKDKDYAIEILDKCDTYAKVGIQNLIDRCLLTIDSCNKLMMHQLIRDMGREIIRKESLEPGERSRLWHHGEAFSVLKNETGTKSIEGLTLDMRMLKKEDNVKKRRYEEFLDKSSLSKQVISLKRRCFSLFSGQSISTGLRGPNEEDLRTDAFEMMIKLRLLQLNYVQLIGCYENFPKNLRWLCWHGFPLKFVPAELFLKNLVVLDMSYSKLEQVWKGIKVLESLKILDLSHSKWLERTPNVKGLPNLERLILKGCVSLVEVCEYIGFLDELVLLDLEDCKSLRKLPRSIHMLKSLETLVFSGCSNIGINNKWQVKSWRSYVSSLVLEPRKNPENLWASLPSSLVKLSLARCNLLDDSFPSGFSNLSLLQELDLSENLFHSLPDGIKSLGGLKLLNLLFCERLQSIIGLPSNVQSLITGYCESLEEVKFQSTSCQLSNVRLDDCKKVVEIQGFFKREPIQKVEGEIFDSLGIDRESVGNLKMKLVGVSNYTELEGPIQGLFEFGIFSTFLPHGEIPSCFSDKNRGSSISFTVPSLPNRRIRCLNVCSVYDYTGANSDSNYESVTIINNKTKDLTWIYCPILFGIPYENEDATWLSQWDFGNRLEVGDEVIVSIVLWDALKVKECGIKIVYDEQEDNKEEDNEKQHKTTDFFNNEVISGDLSDFKVSTGVYFLCRRRSNNEWETEFLREICRGIIDVEEILVQNAHSSVRFYYWPTIGRC